MRIIEPPDLRMTGRNFSRGRTMNLSLARNLSAKTPTIAIGPRNFRSLLQKLSGRSRGGISSDRRAANCSDSLRCIRRQSRLIASVSHVLEGQPEIFNHIRGQKGFLTGGPVENRDLRCSAAEPGPEACGIVERQVLPDERCADAGQHITHSARSHAGIASSVVAEGATALSNNGSAAFEEKRDWIFLAELCRDLGAGAVGVREEMFHLSGMRSEKPRAGAAREYRHVAGENVETISVNNHWACGVGDHLENGAGGSASQSRADSPDIDLFAQE